MNTVELLSHHRTLTEETWNRKAMEMWWMVETASNYVFWMVFKEN